MSGVTSSAKLTREQMNTLDEAMKVNSMVKVANIAVPIIWMLALGVALLV